MHVIQTLWYLEVYLTLGHSRRQKIRYIIVTAIANNNNNNTGHVCM